VRKDNTIMVDSSRYSVPLGTYKSGGAQVRIEKNEHTLQIFALDSREPLAEHRLASSPGQLVINRNHQRDYTKTLDELEQTAVQRYGSGSSLAQFIQGLRLTKRRYLRDQLHALERLARETCDAVMQEAAQQCNTIQRYSVRQLQETVTAIQAQASSKTPSKTPAESVNDTVWPEKLQGQAPRRALSEYTQCFKGA
ncbi:hypothetical protein H1S01_20660, partial [Heliobacterium chlorum]|nr:hypothetical protein [Heliobacterium chlorum]